MIPTVNTKTLIEEKKTEGHAPMLFLCDDGCKYYVKYLMRINEHRFLLYELIGSVLSQHQSIPTPDYAYILIDGDSYSKKDIPRNRKWLRPGVIAFGSKEIFYADLFTELFIPQSRTDYNKYINPIDFVKMSMLDLWMLNTDRKDGRYNFIFENTEHGKKIYSIDHAFSFGGIKQNYFSAHDNIHIYETLINSAGLRAFTKNIPKNILVGCVDDFYYLCNNDSQKKIEKLFAAIPVSWQIDQTHKDKILDFLYNPKRLQKLKIISQQSLLT